MESESVIAVARGLQEAGVRYLVVGGVAVNLHGYQRFTKDLDLVIHLEAENLKRAMNALADLGYRPRLPVAVEDFADPPTREDWVNNRNMMVFQLWSDAYRGSPIDVFVREPFDFEEAWQDAKWRALDEGVRIPLLDIRRLEALKREAGRDRDLQDAENLARIRQLLDR